MSRIILLVPVLLLAATIPLTRAAAQAAAGWVTVSSTHVADQNERPQAVVAPAAGDVWAIGYRLDYIAGTPEFRTLAEHYDGTNFVAVPIPGRGSRDFLNGAAASGSDDVWAVGTSLGLGSPDQTLIEHWDGTSWTIVASPNPGALSDDLQAASASSASDVWAVGARINQGHFYQVPMTLHWDGTAWRTVRTPNAHGCTGHSYLTGVSALSPTSAWATGWCGSGGSSPERGYVLHWDGLTWNVATIIPQAIASNSETYGIAAKNANNIWVVGSYLRGSERVTAPLTYHFNGHSWAFVPGEPSAITLVSVTVGPAGIWSVGAGTSPQPPFAGPAAARYLSPAWRNHPVSISFGRLNAVTTAPDGMVWAVGSQILPSGDDTALIVHR